MTVVYLIRFEEGFEGCLPVDEDLLVTLEPLFTGRPLRHSWVPFEARMIRQTTDGVPLKETDSPYSSFSALILRSRALHAMKPIIEKCGELLPLRCADAEVSLFNVTTVIDALDEEASKVLRFPSGRIMDVERYMFHPDRVLGMAAFKLPWEQGAPILVGEAFVELWTEAGLCGILFEEVWSSD